MNEDLFLIEHILIEDNPYAPWACKSKIVINSCYVRGSETCIKEGVDILNTINHSYYGKYNEITEREDDSDYFCYHKVEVDDFFKSVSMNFPELRRKLRKREREVMKNEI